MLPLWRCAWTTILTRSPSAATGLPRAGIRLAIDGGQPRAGGRSCHGAAIGTGTWNCPAGRWLWSRASVCGPTTVVATRGSGARLCQSLQPFERQEVYAQASDAVKAIRTPAKLAEIQRALDAEWEGILAASKTVRQGMDEFVPKANELLKP